MKLGRLLLLSVVSMFDFLFNTDNAFEAYGPFHWMPILIYGILLSLSILYAKYRLEDNQKINFGILLFSVPAICVCLRMMLTAIEGTFSIQEELPLHLCRTLALAMPFVIYYKSEKGFGVLYFFTLVGTLQALLTPDLPLSAPHHSYHTYWALHCILIAFPFYGIFVLGWIIRKRDFWNAIIAGNVYLVITGLVNIMIGSNCFFTSHKPPSPTLLDLLGPWLWYILAVEGLAILMFLIVEMPFWLGKEGDE